MTAQDVVSAFNVLMNEPTPVRWPNAAAIILLCDALDELWWRRRSAFNLTSIPTAMPAKPTAVGSTVYVQDSYRQSMAHYMAFLAFMEDAEDSGNAKLAAAHYDLYEKGIG